MKKAFAVILVFLALFIPGTASAKERNWSSKDMKKAMAGAFLEGFTAGSCTVLASNLVILGNCQQAKEVLEKAKKTISAFSELSNEAPESFALYQKLILNAEDEYKQKCTR